MSAKPLSVRLARDHERTLLEDLQRRASLANEADRAFLLDNPDAISLRLEHIADGSVIVAERDGTVTGFAVVLSRDDGDSELDGLFVDPAAWRRGAGRRLVEEAVQIAFQRGAVRLHVVANPEALGFYCACGFDLSGETQTRFRRAPLMVLRIGAKAP